MAPYTPGGKVGERIHRSLTGNEKMIVKTRGTQNKTMRVMTFNLRFENDQDGTNAWAYRRGLVVELIERYAPAILGTQEGRLSQLDYLESRLPDYRMHAPARVLDDTCQYPTLFFRRDQIRILEGSEFWLSKTPAIHRSKNWGQCLSPHDEHREGRDNAIKTGFFHSRHPSGSHGRKSAFRAGKDHFRVGSRAAGIGYPHGGFQ